MENAILDALRTTDARSGSARGTSRTGSDPDGSVSRPIFEFDAVTGAPLMVLPRALRNRLPNPTARVARASRPAPAPASHCGPAAPEIPDDMRAPATLAEARERIERSAARIADLEDRLRATLERLGRRTTEVRNLTARLEAAEVPGATSQAILLSREPGGQSTFVPLGATPAGAASSAGMTVTRDQSRALGELVGVLREEMATRDTRIARLQREHAAAIAEIARLRAIHQPAPVLPEASPSSSPDAA